MNIKKQLLEGKTIYDLPLKVVYYARVSTDQKEQQSSIINQINYFINYIKNNKNWTLVYGYIDKGISGKNINNRLEFKKMIKDAKEKKFNLILTKSVSRFARNTIDSIYYTNLLQDIGIGVYFLNDNINTFYSDSEFRLTLMASIAQDELRKLSESVKFGLKQSINRGIVLGNNNLLGFHKEKGKLTIKEDEAVIIKDIFKYYLEIPNYSIIANKINKQYQKKLTSTSIKRILTNPKYKGYYCGRKSEVINYKNNKRKNYSQDEWLTYKDYEIIPPIIEEKIWDEVNNKILYKKNTYINPYKNKVYCYIHGKTLTKVKKYKNKVYYYYICKDCFRFSSNILDKITKIINFKKIIINNKEEYYQINIFYNKT